jgi:hypothetical protein
MMVCPSLGGLRARFALAAACSTSMLRGWPRRALVVSVAVGRGWIERIALLLVLRGVSERSSDGVDMLFPMAAVDICVVTVWDDSSLKSEQKT